MTTMQEYLLRFRRAHSEQTLDLMADAADRDNPQDHKAINDAWNQRWHELKRGEYVRVRA